MTIIDFADVRRKTCSICGAVYGDRDLHRLWHEDHAHDLDQLRDALAMMRAAAEELVAIFTEPQEDPCP